VWYGKAQTVKSKASEAPVVMPDALVAMLKQFMTSWRPNPEQYLFVNRNGRPYSQNKIVEYGLWPVLDALGIERAGMHAFRHCHASLLIHVGANTAVTRDQMRHADASVTLGVYGHVIGDAQRDAVGKKWARFCAQLRPSWRRPVSIFNNLHGAGDGNRTHVRSLGSSYSAIELRPLALNLVDYT